TLTLSPASGRVLAPRRASAYNSASGDASATACASCSSSSLTPLQLPLHVVIKTFVPRFARHAFGRRAEVPHPPIHDDDDVIHAISAENDYALAGSDIFRFTHRTDSRILSFQ